jgi:glycosyltransferase involved in cell wall biosynthesis
MPGRLFVAARDADVLIGRNLESLALAVSAGRANPAAGIVYECLDIHRVLLGRSLPARLVQGIERRLLRHVELLLTSSPAFVREYFNNRSSLAAPTLLVENKLLALDGAPAFAAAGPDGPPWVIGWFGMLRCARTFEVLAGLARRSEGKIKVRVAGRPSPAVFPEFLEQVAAVSHMDYLGPYRSEDLPRLYGSCHFAWAIDYFEEGMNSRWLLPNRLYEAAAFGVVPIALASVETGRWLVAREAGLVLDDALSGLEVLQELDRSGFTAMRSAVAAIPREDLIAKRGDCDAIVLACEAARK